MGRNLWDHVTVLFPIVFDKEHTSLIFERDVLIDMIEQYDPPGRVGTDSLTLSVICDQRVRIHPMQRLMFASQRSHGFSECICHRILLQPFQ